MKRTTASYAVKKEAQRLYEVEGLSDAKISEVIGFHATTIRTWRTSEGWAERGSVAAFVPEDSDTTTTTGATTLGTPEDFAGTIEPSNTVEVLTVSNADEVGVLKSRIAELETEVEAFRPDVDISVMLFKNAEDLEVIFDEQYWRDRAQSEFRVENQQRKRDNLELLTHTEEELVGVIARLKEEELISRNRPADGPASKRIKMVKPNPDGSYYPPHIVSLPYEAQVNNVAGSLADGLVIYTNKGYKLTSPFLCPRRACFVPAAVDAANEWIYDGYCSDVHRIETEKPTDAPTPGVTVRDVVGSLTR